MSQVQSCFSPHAERTLLSGFNRHRVLKGLVYSEGPDKDPGQGISSAIVSSSKGLHSFLCSSNLL
jgi:hypothetical protein